MAIFEQLSKILTRYPSLIGKGAIDILEYDEKATVRKVTWINSDFNYFDSTLAKDMTAFFQKSTKNELFCKDCDGVIIFEHGGKKYMFITELKSGFSTEIFYKAKTQILSSFIKTNMILHLLSCYKLEDYIVKGFIVGHPPKPDFIYNVSKADMLKDSDTKKKHEFARSFFIKNKSHIRFLKPKDFYCLKGLPLGDRGIFQNIELYFIEVKDGDSEIKLDVTNYI